ncbi:alkaline phosphatase [Prauserella coralliicola]|nr:alkaline phosphatase [Prauserella coralliicola]
MSDRSSSHFSRRTLLGGVTGAAALGVTALGGSGLAAARASSSPPKVVDPFTLGVASGDPLPDGVVLWTRLAPDPLNGGGMPARPVPVQWQVATDERFATIVREGTVLAHPESAHSVHVEVSGLQPRREYFYRFRAESELSPMGRTKTAPALGAPIDAVTFSFLSCQNFPAGYYTAYRNMVDEDLDLVIHLGDYIYEGPSQGALGRGHLPQVEVRSLADYRIRHAQYKTDADLQAAHAAFPWLVTWDDHEVENNYADEESDPDTPPAQFLARRAVAYQAYYEHMPLRRSSMPTGADMTLYRRISYGELVDFNVLDTRQYRSDQPRACAPETRDPSGYCAEALDEGRTMLGARQRQWLLDGLANSPARWKVLAQQVPFAPMDQDADLAERSFGGDKWDGYVADRQRILDLIAQRQVDNPVVITGDVHVNRVCNVPPNFTDFDAAPVATEFIGTSVTSGGDRTLNTRYDIDPNNPHLLFRDNHHGYVRCTLKHDQWVADYRVVDTVEAPTSPIHTLASFAVDSGKAGAHRT